MKKSHIAIFDSGIGGFTTLIDAVRILPEENFLYYADTKNVPYGNKSIETVRQLTMDAVADMLKYNVKAVILACNTATSAGASRLRSEYSIPIIGMEPAVKLALQSTQKNTKARRVLLMSTTLTMNGEKLGKLLETFDKQKLVDCIALPELVEMAERMEFSGKNVLEFFRHLLHQYDLENYGAIVLGCTHFIWYKELLKKILPTHIQLIDGNLGTIHHLKRLLEENKIIEQGKQKGEVLLHFTKESDPFVFQKLVEQLKCNVKLV